MNLNQEPEEHTMVGVACGHLVAVPTAQLADYYRGQRWFAGLGLAIVLIYLVVFGLA